MQLPAKTTKFILGILFIFFFGIGWWVGYHLPIFNKTVSVTTQNKKPLYWIDTMEPNVHYPGPGKSHMGMELVPVFGEETMAQHHKNDHSIKITSAVENNLGVRTAPVIQGLLSREIITVGYIQPNENNITHIHPYADGWIRGLAVKFVGTQVKKGDLLFRLYSPTLQGIEEEYLLTLHSHDQNMINASYKKLQTFNVSEQQIKNITQTKKIDPLIDIYSPQDGIVTELTVRDGMRVTPDTETMSLLDLSSVWMIADVFENQAAWVQVGLPAQATLDTLPGKVWNGTVDYVYPEVDPITRTVKVRLRFSNSEQTLKPNMYANIKLSVDPKQTLSIPREALLINGDVSYVVVSLGHGRYEPRKVTTGIESGDHIEILSGLQPQEKVVISGQFLLDSEANLKSGLERIDSQDQKHDQ